MERKREEARVRVRKVVIPVAGWGTRSLPASKNIPKEMLPIYDKPVIQHVVEEAVRAGIRDVVFVTSRSRPSLGIISIIIFSWKKCWQRPEKRRYSTK